jgi:serine phosphatase RsbU (regulator of sigma subunit)
MIVLLHFLQRKLRPELSERPAHSRYLLMCDVVGIFYGFPLVIFGLLWLSFETDWTVFSHNWHWMVVILVTVIVFSRLRFFMMHTVQSGPMVGVDGDFIGVILWACILIFGQAIIWLFFFWNLVELMIAWRRSGNHDRRWNSARSACLNIASLLIPSILSLRIYQNIGGQIPMRGLMTQALLPAMFGILSFGLIYFLIWLPFILYVVWVGSKFDRKNAGSLFWFTVATMELPFISLPFGVLASGILVEHGTLVLAIYFIGLLLIALLANQLSQSAEKSRRQAVQLMGLERLGRDILAAPADARNLPGQLRRHIPDMFPCRNAIVWVSPETYLLKYPDGKVSYAPAVWDWLLTQAGPEGFLEHRPLPWDNTATQHYPLLTMPILDPFSGEPMGGLIIELLSLPQKWDQKTLQEHFPALQNLAAQIASALQQTENYQESLKHQRVTLELKMAGDIQLSFLPERPPELPGWDIATSLKPARQTSGDFYDFFELEGGRLGILIADVADKGLGAALYMALGRTLLLTYAQEYPDNPAAVLQATNQRMLSDARAQMFITAIYGVLNPKSGRLIYCNAGHLPPLLLREHVRKLRSNGIALGIDENAAWVAISQRIEVGDKLLLYTDGVVEANNPAGDFYEMHNLTDIATKVANRPSQWIIRAIMKDVLDFQNGAAQADDITLMCISRRE